VQDVETAAAGCGCWALWTGSGDVRVATVGAAVLGRFFYEVFTGVFNCRRLNADGQRQLGVLSARGGEGVMRCGRTIERRRRWGGGGR